MKRVFVFFLLALCSYAQTLQRVVLSIDDSPVIKSKQEQISAAKKNLIIETTYKNPVVSVGANDLLLRGSQFLNRTIEPMQSQYVALAQEIETYGKLDAKNNIYSKQVEFLNFELKDLRFELIKKARALNAQILANDKILEILKSKVENLKILNNYYLKLTGVGENIAKSIQIQKSIYEQNTKIYELRDATSKLKNDYFYLTSKTYMSFEDEIKPTYIKEALVDTPKYKSFLASTQILKENLSLANKQKYPNATVALGYNHREDRTDYLNLSVSFSLPIYGREDAAITKTSHLLQETIYRTQNFLNQVSSIFEANLKKVEFLSESLIELQKVIISYKELIAYNKQNIKNSSNIDKVVELENANFDFLIQEIKLKNSIELATLELNYLTQGEML